MEKWLRNLLILLILFIGWASYYLSSQIKFSRVEIIEEETPAVIKKNNKIADKKEEPTPESLIPPPEAFTAEPPAPPVPTYSENIDSKQKETIIDQADVISEVQGQNQVAICYARLADCRGAGIMFKYPSPENTWSEEKDNEIIECIAKVENCKSGNYQIISPEEEAQILNHYRNQEKTF